LRIGINLTGDTECTGLLKFGPNESPSHSIPKCEERPEIPILRFWNVVQAVKAWSNQDRFQKPQVQSEVRMIEHPPGRKKTSG